MDPKSRPLWLLFYAGIAVFALAILIGAAFSLQRLGVPPSISVNPAHLANVLLREGNLASAVVELQAFEAITPDGNVSILTLAGVLTDLGRRREALAAYRRGVASLPHSPKAHSLLGEELFVQRQFADASASFETVLAINPRYPDAQENLAVSYLNAGRTSDAIETYNGVLQAGDGSASTHDMLSRAYEIAGDHDRAFEHAKIAFQFSPSDPNIRSHFDALTHRGSKKNGQR